MKLITRFLFIIAVLGAQHIKANSITANSGNTANADSAKDKSAYNKSIQKQAVHDTRNFKIPADKADDFKKGLISKSSDYFKPTSAYASDPNMLNDSTYVKEFRQVAYYRAGHHSAGKALKTAGLVLLGFAALFVLAYAIFGAK